MPKRTHSAARRAKPPAAVAAAKAQARATPAPKQPAPTDGNVRSVRELRGAARREAILAAALEEFSASGFAAARLDDVARRAGVAKGTIYLYFADKEALFQELARSMLSPFVGNIEAFASADIPFPKLIDALADAFVRDVIETRRRDIIRLIISEGVRFPSLAEFYHREVLSRIIVAIRTVLQRAYDRGELRHKALIEFPQLLGAPGLVAIIWNSLFGKQAPIDARAMLKVYLDIILDRGDAT